MLTAAQWLEELTRLAVEAGADPVRARERMAQAAQVIESERGEVAQRVAQMYEDNR